MKQCTRTILSGVSMMVKWWSITVLSMLYIVHCFYQGYVSCKSILVMECVVDTRTGATAIKYCTVGCCGYHVHHNRSCCADENDEPQGSTGALLMTVYVAVTLFGVALVIICLCCCVNSCHTPSADADMQTRIAPFRRHESRIHAREEMPTFPPTPLRFTESSVPSAAPVDSFLPYSQTQTDT